MATLPKSIQRQLDEANALEAQQAAPAQQEVVDDVSQFQAAPAQQPAPAPAAPPAEPPAPPAEDWQQKYRTVQGRYQAEVPELRAQNRRMESELAAAREQLAALGAAVQKLQNPPAEPAQSKADPRDEQVFGADMVEMVNRYAQRTFAAAQQRIDQVVSGFEQRIAALEQNVSGVSQRTEKTMESQFYATLEQLVPDWRAVNVTPEWLEWLGTVDEVYNVPRQTALDVAFERRDAPRVAAVFKQFTKSKPAKAATETMSTLVSPSEGGGGPVTPPPQQQAKPMFSQKAVQQFYMDVARGRYRDRDAERVRLETEIDTAAREGRIV